MTATYGGDTNFGVSSASLKQTVKQASSNVTLTSSAPSANVGQTITFSLVVGPVTDGFTPTGAIVLKDGSTVFLSLPLDNTGSASFSMSTLSGGNHTITASYAGDSNFTSSTAKISEQILKLPNTVTITSSPNPYTVGDPSGFSLVFLVAPPLGVSLFPTGNVVLKDGPTVLATVSVFGGSVNYNITTISPGNPAETGHSRGAPHRRWNGW